nr:unnamed protein product [Callosobruchus analis]
MIDLDRRHTGSLILERSMSFEYLPVLRLTAFFKRIVDQLSYFLIIFVYSVYRISSTTSRWLHLLFHSSYLIYVRRVYKDNFGSGDFLTYHAPVKGFCNN